MTRIRAIPPRDATNEVRDVSLLQVATLVIWLGCLAAGGLGLALHYARPRPASAPPAPIQAEFLNVELTSDPMPPTDVAPPPPNIPQPPPAPDNSTPPLQAPALIAVAEPSPEISFPIPVEGPTQVVESRLAAPVRETLPAPTAPAPPTQRLIFGQGEGRQPSPSYPAMARRQGQEGIVGVRFAVGEDGGVISADAAAPSPWPLLNREAVRTIRERWRFQPGPMRLYEVAIRFELQK